jgi:uncharacterized membrane protein YgdD (TMEM256/DUF423 family)
MQNFYLKTAAILGALAVALGAFGAHTLKKILSDKYLEVFETAVRYQFYHVFALIAVGILLKEFPNNKLALFGCVESASVSLNFDKKPFKLFLVCCLLELFSLLFTF